MQDNWATLRAQIEYFSKPFPREAIAFANEHRFEVAPHLVEVLARVAASPAIAVEDLDYILYEYAMHLRDTRAYAPMLSLGYLDEDTLEGVMSESVTEVYGRCLAGVCDGDLQPLKQLFEDTRASYWARSAALDAMVVRVMEGDASRDELVQYLIEQGDLHAQGLRLPDTVIADLEVIDFVVAAACRLVAVDLKVSIQSWFDDDLLDIMMTDRAWVDACMNESFEASRQRILVQNKGYIRDVEAEMGWWAAFIGQSVRRNAAMPVNDDEAMWAPAPIRYNPQPIEIVVRSGPKIGHNDPCPCGSGKKYKKCYRAG